LKRFITALAATAAIAVGAVGLTTSPAAAHTFGPSGPSHTHNSCTMGSGGGSNWCYRWILANGAIIQGPQSLMSSQYGYVLAYCSYSTSAGYWLYNLTPYGPWGNTGNHTYCQNPKYTFTHGYYGAGTYGWAIKP
jgi:hypothetical protein